MRYNECMRIVLHVDMDSFFASIEERDHPRLKGLPIVVGSDPKNGKGRGVVSTANYPARKYGIRSAVPISRAWKLSQQAKKAGQPEVVFMDVDMAKYARVSKEIMNYIASQGEAFQAGGIDECYLELISSKNNWKTARARAEKIRKYIKEKFKLTCSIGVGPNKLIAKIAVEDNKPDGLTVVRDEEVQKFLDSKSVRVIPGIGPKAEQALLQIGVETIKDLRQKTKGELVEAFGKRGGDFYQRARGISDSPVEAGGEAKSIGRDMTLEKDTLDPKILLPHFKAIAEDVFSLIKKEKLVFKTIMVVVRFEGFETHTKGHSLERPAKELNIIETEAMKLLLPFLDGRQNPKRKKIRLIGIRLSNLGEYKPGLFD